MFSLRTRITKIVMTLCTYCEYNTGVKLLLGFLHVLYVVLHPSPNLARIKRKVVHISLFDTDEMKRVNELCFNSAAYSAT